MEIVAKRKWRYPLSYERNYAKLLVAYVQRKFKVIRAFAPELREAMLSLSDAALRTEIIIDGISRAVENAETMTNVIKAAYEQVNRYNQAEFDAIMTSLFGTTLSGSPSPRC